MTLYKNINGKRVEMTAQEAAEIRAEWLVNKNPIIDTKKINEEIDKLLSTTDWTQVADASLTNAEKVQWAAYRTALRAVDRTPRPRNLGLPTPPSDIKRNGR